MALYTRRGDSGETDLANGWRTAKNDARVDAYGTLDELSACLGLARASLRERVEGRKFGGSVACLPSKEETPEAGKFADSDGAGRCRNSIGCGSEGEQNCGFHEGTGELRCVMDGILAFQWAICALSGYMATPGGAFPGDKVGGHLVERMESDIDRWMAIAGPLRNFVMPGSSRAEATIHLARTVCRRAERLIVDLSQSEPVDEMALTFLNRLSDWLFAASRIVDF